VPRDPRTPARRAILARGLAGRALGDLLFQVRTAFAFQLLAQLAAFALVGPLITWAARRLVLASGDAVVSNTAIAGFLLSIPGAAFVLVVGALGAGALLAEFAGQSSIAGYAIARSPITLTDTAGAVLRRLPALIVLGARLLVRLTVLALPFIAALLLIWRTQLSGHDINYYLAARPPEWRRALALALILAAGYALVALRQLGRWLFAVPILVFESAPPGRALAESSARTRGRLGHILTPLTAWWLLLVGGGILIARPARHLEAVALGWAGLELTRVLALISAFVVLALVASFLHGALLIAGHQFLVMRMYAEEFAAGTWRAAAAPEPESQHPRRLATRIFIATAALLTLGFGAAWLVAAQYTPEAEPLITAHRGDSVEAPENTLAAFRAAIAARATFSELDVQRTRDGLVVVLHDGDLMRLAGDPRKIGDLTAAELATIDVGRKFGEAFRGEHVPSLDAVIDLVRGRMKINVELKYNAPDPGLAAAVVEVLRRKNFLDQVVITSLSAAALRQIRAIEPQLTTGMIVAAAVGDVTRADTDFLSLNSARATPAVIGRAHLAGKQVHVWTVNRAEVMLRMIERGVDNIITDDPVLALRVVAERRALTPTELLALHLRVLFSEPPPELTDPAAVTVL
jgi:glycerophosphoryl diester phosphodiesterase